MYVMKNRGMEGLVELLERYRSGISKTFSPAKDADIEDLLSIEPDIPGAYLEFLRTMGDDTGDFQIDGGNAGLSADGLADLWRWTVPETRKRCLYIGQDNGL